MAMTDHEALTHSDAFVIYSALAMILGDLGHGVLAFILAMRSLLSLWEVWKGCEKADADRRSQAPP